MRKLVITGGHLTPALAVIDEIRARWARVEILFVGREYAQLATGQRSQEFFPEIVNMYCHWIITRVYN